MLDLVNSQEVGTVKKIEVVEPSLKSLSYAER